MIPIHTSSAVLPDLYAAWMDELLGGPIPEESEATCDDCVMCKKGGNHDNVPDVDIRFFSPQTKCCTYLPKLANFLVGRIMRDKNPESAHGRATIEERLIAGVAVTPMGIGVPQSYNLLYKRGTPAFGRSTKLRCPHYVGEKGGLCGIWKNRNSVCATWFCKHVRGAVGKDFWKTLEQLFSQVETSLASWCILELGMDSRALKTLFPVSGTRPAQISEYELDGRPDTKENNRIWGRWRGREHKFFEQCAKLVEPLAWQDVARLGGSLLQIHTRLALQSYSELMTAKLPARARVGSLRMISQTREFTRVSAYSRNNPLDVPKVLMENLHYFNGRPVQEAMAAIADAEGVALSEKLVRKLLDYRILVEVHDSDESSGSPSRRVGARRVR